MVPSHSLLENKLGTIGDGSYDFNDKLKGFLIIKKIKAKVPLAYLPGKCFTPWVYT